MTSGDYLARVSVSQAVVQYIAEIHPDMSLSDAAPALRHAIINAATYNPHDHSIRMCAEMGLQSARDHGLLPPWVG